MAPTETVGSPMNKAWQGEWYRRGARACECGACTCRRAPSSIVRSPPLELALVSEPSSALPNEDVWTAAATLAACDAKNERVEQS
eukprot:1580322-Pleurochrysis_carterae.AAC.1